jgi:hypothetical protein
VYQVTIYSPVDKQEQVFGCKSTEDLDKVVTGLTSMMEVGSWFKIEKIQQSGE